MSNDPNVKIYESVKGHYGAIAESSGSQSCCDDDCGCSPVLYSPELTADLPVDVTGLSLGCGDPVTIAGLRHGETVLDLGSGGGIDCFLAAKQVGETGFVIGVDMTPAMLEKANANKTKMGVQNVEFRQGQIEDLPVDNNTIDVIMSNCVINLSPNKADVFAEAFRVLKPGGRVSISDIVTEGEFSDDLRADMDQWSECVTGAIDADIYTGMMRSAGFINVAVVDKVNAEPFLERKDGMPRIFSARIVGNKPV